MCCNHYILTQHLHSRTLAPVPGFFVNYPACTDSDSCVRTSDIFFTLSRPLVKFYCTGHLFLEKIFDYFLFPVFFNSIFQLHCISVMFIMVSRIMWFNPTVFYEVFRHQLVESIQFPGTEGFWMLFTFTTYVY